MKALLPGLARRCLGLLILIALFLPAVRTMAAEVVRIGGSGSDLGTITLLAAAFERAHPGVRVQVLPSLGTGGAIKAVTAKAIDVGLMIRSLTDEEQKLGLKTMIYARTPFVFAVHRDVRYDDITTGELIAILNGKRTTWPDGRRIRLVLRPPTDYEMTILKTLSPEVARALESALRRPGMMSALTAQECASLLEATSGSFGFSNLGLVRSEGRQLKLLAFNGIAPTMKNVVSGAYPLAHVFSLAVGPEPSRAALSFIRYVYSPAGRKVLEDTGHEAVSGGL